MNEVGLVVINMVSIAAPFLVAAMVFMVYGRRGLMGIKKVVKVIPAQEVTEYQDDNGKIHPSLKEAVASNLTALMISKCQYWGRFNRETVDSLSSILVEIPEEVIACLKSLKEENDC